MPFPMDYIIYFSPVLMVFIALILRIKAINYTVVVFLVLFIGLRGAGGDIIGYTNYYNASNFVSDIAERGLSSDKSTIKYSIEFFYSFINSFSKSLGGGLTLVFFTTSLFFTFLIYHASIKFNKLNPYIFFTFFIVTSYMPLGMHYVRQGLAVAFLSLAIAYYNSPKKRLLAIILALGSHIVSGIVGLVLVYVMGMKRKSLIVLMAAPFLALLLNKEILDLISFVFVSSDSTMLQRYPERFGNSRGISSLDKVLVILTMVNFIYLSYKKKPDLMVGRFMATAIFYLVFIVFSSNVDVFSRYFTLLYPFLLYFSYEALVVYVKQKRLILIIHLFLAFLIFFRFVNDSRIQELFFPFKFFLE